MVKVVSLSVTDVTLAALSAILAYRYLSVHQIATICAIKPKSASEMLLRLERHGLLGHFGNTGIRGYGKTPKVYFLKKRGYQILAKEREAVGKVPPPFRPVNMSTRWSPLMFHRLATLDVLSYVERDCCRLQDYDLLGTLVEYRREKIGNRWQTETTDFVSENKTPDDRIVPDAGFALEHRHIGKRALFLIEVDMGTTRLQTNKPDQDIATYTAKLAQYDRYLASGRIKDRHPHLGQFSGFHMLTITTSDRRVANMRRAASTLSPDFHQFFRFSTLDRVRQFVLHADWLSRDHADLSKYSLIKGN